MNSSHGEKPTNVKNIQVDCFPAVGPYGAETSFTVIGSTPTPDPRQPAAVSWTAARPGPVLVPTAASQVKKRSIDPLRLAFLSAAGPGGDPPRNPLGNHRRGRHMDC